MENLLIGMMFLSPIPVHAETIELLPAPQVVEVSTRSQKLINAIKDHESGGNYEIRGDSGEIGAYQFMPSTFKSASLKYLGQEIEPTPLNQDLIARLSIEDLIAQGYSDKEIALIWNSGTTEIRKGINKYGVPYDTEAYANIILSKLES